MHLCHFPFIKVSCAIYIPSPHLKSYAYTPVAAHFPPVNAKALGDLGFVVAVHMQKFDALSFFYGRGKAFKVCVYIPTMCIYCERLILKPLLR